MNRERLEPARFSWTELWQTAQRERALLALFEFGRKPRWAFRAARLYAFTIFVSYAIAISLTGGAERGPAIRGLVHAALIALSWGVGAPAALGAARVLAEPGERCALTMLALERGMSRAALRRARVLSEAVRIARWVAIPALLLVGWALIRGGSAAWALAVAPAVLVYAGALGLSLALLAWFAAELSPRHPRAMLSLLVLGPWLIQQVQALLPSLPGMLSLLLNRVLQVGAELS